MYAVQRAVPSLRDAACLPAGSILVRGCSGGVLRSTSPTGWCRSHGVGAMAPVMPLLLLLLHTAYPSALCAPGARGAACIVCCMSYTYDVVHHPDVVMMVLRMLGMW